MITFLFKEWGSTVFIKQVILEKIQEMVFMILIHTWTLSVTHELILTSLKVKYSFNSHIPFLITVHSIHSVPFCIQLSEHVPDLNGFRTGGFKDDIWLLLMNNCNLLSKFVQLIFDILQTSPYKHRIQ